MNAERKPTSTAARLSGFKSSARPTPHGEKQTDNVLGKFISNSSAEIPDSLGDDVSKGALTTRSLHSSLKTTGRRNGNGESTAASAFVSRMKLVGDERGVARQLDRSSVHGAPQTTTTRSRSKGRTEKAKASPQIPVRLDSPQKSSDTARLVTGRTKSPHNSRGRATVDRVARLSGEGGSRSRPTQRRSKSRPRQKSGRTEGESRSNGERRTESGDGRKSSQRRSHDTTRRNDEAADLSPSSITDEESLNEQTGTHVRPLLNRSTSSLSGTEPSGNTFAASISNMLDPPNPTDPAVVDGKQLQKPHHARASSSGSRRSRSRRDRSGSRRRGSKGSSGSKSPKRRSPSRRLGDSCADFGKISSGGRRRKSGKGSSVKKSSRRRTASHKADAESRGDDSIPTPVQRALSSAEDAPPRSPPKLKTHHLRRLITPGQHGSSSFISDKSGVSSDPNIVNMNGLKVPQRSSSILGSTLVTPAADRAPISPPRRTSVSAAKRQSQTPRKPRRMASEISMSFSGVKEESSSVSGEEVVQVIEVRESKEDVFTQFKWTSGVEQGADGKEKERELLRQRVRKTPLFGSVD